MKLCTHAMSGIFPDDAIAAFLAIALHRAADITDPAPATAARIPS